MTSLTVMLVGAGFCLFVTVTVKVSVDPTAQGEVLQLPVLAIVSGLATLAMPAELVAVNVLDGRGADAVLIRALPSGTLESTVALIAMAAVVWAASGAVGQDSGGPRLAGAGAAEPML